MKKAIVLSSVLSLTAFSLAMPLDAEDHLSEKEYLQLRADLKPSADDSWRTIPWKIGLLDAQRTAATENKPIFIWAMDGHPLGCT